LSASGATCAFSTDVDVDGAAGCDFDIAFDIATFSSQCGPICATFCAPEFDGDRGDTSRHCKGLGCPCVRKCFVARWHTAYTRKATESCLASESAEPTAFCVCLEIGAGVASGAESEACVATTRTGLAGRVGGAFAPACATVVGIGVGADARPRTDLLSCWAAQRARSVCAKLACFAGCATGPTVFGIIAQVDTCATTELCASWAATFSGRTAFSCLACGAARAAVGSI
jgi:hypothetical protein